MTEYAALIVFPILMAYAATSDLLTMTISNVISAALVVSFVAMAVLLGLPAGQIAAHLACGAAILVLTFGLFTFGWIGGGDAKLAAATALWVGWDHLLDYGLIASVLGGLLTLLLLQARRWPLPSWASRTEWIGRLHDQNTGVPYGIALAIGGLIVYPDTIVWLRTIGAAVAG